MKNKFLKLMTSIVVFITIGCQKKTNNNNQFTAINPLSYTSVVFNATSDTVLVSTYSGRISQVIKNRDQEELIINLNDEIYGLEYAKKQHVVMATTLKSGVIVIDLKTRKIKKELNVKNDAWINSVHLSENEEYLTGLDIKGNSYIWDINNDYELLDFSEELPKNYIRLADNNGNLYYQNHLGKYIQWDPKKKKIIKELMVNGRLVDLDDKGNLAFLNFNEFGIYNTKVNNTAILKFKEKHPYTIYIYPNGDTVHNSHHLKLTDLRFSDNKVFTAGLDKTIRIWDKQNGNLVDEWYSHNATISDLDISSNKKQLVSVDLKGGIKFWEL
ncbi:hypothetical protein GTQ40_07125 [Flavobacteriaceae bacterium R38]|nr:hypothetical protein [Flavobacteriaceae bacterium R38]